MAQVADVIRSVKMRRTENPRTILAFFATVLGLMFVAAVSMIAILATEKVDEGSIPLLIIGAGIIFLLLVGGVFFVMLKDPSKLMLGKVTGDEFIGIQRLMLGDSQRGERELPIADTRSGLPIVLTDGETTPSSAVQSTTESEETT